MSKLAGIKKWGRILNGLVYADNAKDFDRNLQSFTEIGFTKIAEDNDWDDSQKLNWRRAIENNYIIFHTEEYVDKLDELASKRERIVNLTEVEEPQSELAVELIQSLELEKKQPKDWIDEAFDEIEEIIRNNNNGKSKQIKEVWID
jgi:hypothetical protein